MLPLRRLVHAARISLNSSKCSQLSFVRHGTYFNSPTVEDPSQYTDYEVTKNPEEWKYVERLFKLPAIPVVKPKDSYPSGWMPQTVDPKKCPWFIHRTKSHMMPVYLLIDFRGQRRRTLVKKIEGDIWKLYEELSAWLKEVNPDKIMGIKVNEVQNQILIHGDHVNQIRKFLFDKGY